MTPRAQRVLLMAAMLCNVECLAAERELFTTRAWPITGDVPAGTVVYVLDEAERIEAELSRGLSADPTLAMPQAQHAIVSHSPTLTNTLTTAYQGLQKAKTYGLTHLPAWVVDGRVQAVGAGAVQAVIEAGQPQTQGASRSTPFE